MSFAAVAGIPERSPTSVAVTWGNGTSGISGLVSSSNSLIGSTANDTVGAGNVVPLTNGNYFVLSSSWDSGTITDVGAVTWGNGTTGISGWSLRAIASSRRPRGDDVRNAATRYRDQLETDVVFSAVTGIPEQSPMSVR
ncbi:MAG UNVERIFIED_CONTAM: hypothetical protein LVR18_46310 [Planctomycetaceae bacterium]|jgi:hypothetical protein